MEALMKPTAMVYFSNDEYVIQFEEKLNTYYQNVQMLQNNTMLLEKLCNKSPKLPNCRYYQKELKEITEVALRTTQYMRMNKRSKRELCCFLVALLTVTITTAIVSFIAGAAIASNSNKEMAEQQNLQTNATTEYLSYSIRNLDLQNLSTSMYFEDQKTLNNITEIEYINQITITSLLAADRHNRNTQKYQEILGNNLKEKFFTFIDIYKFNKTFHEQKYDSPLSSLHPKDIIALSSLDAELMNDVITINVHIPAVLKSKFYLTSIIPIPVIRDNNNFILNFDEKYLIEYGDIIAEISPYVLAQCPQAANITICHTTIFDQISPVDHCVEAIRLNKTTKALCTYKSLPFTTQLIKTSNKSVYVHIINPILLKISCGQQSKIINITRSEEIYHDQNCKPYELKTSSKNSTITIVEIESDLAELNFEIFENEKWSNKQILADEFKNKINDLMRDFKHLSNDYNQRAKMIEISDSNPFSLLFNFFDNLIYFILILVSIIVILIISMIMICCISRK